MADAPPPYSPMDQKSAPPQGENTPLGNPPGTVPVYVQQPVTTVVQLFRESPVRMRCMFCQAEVVTSTYYDNGTLTWLACFFIFLFFPLGCCLIPFCMDAMKDVIHRCPNCNQQVGRFNRM